MTQKIDGKIETDEISKILRIHDEKDKIILELCSYFETVLNDFDSERFKKKSIKSIKINVNHNQIAIQQMIDEVTETLYQAYGSGTGVLFGIPAELRPSVRAIVKVVLTREEKK